ncbi:MAG TPA: hypothetical protein VF988_08880 [Verrucomicrobiae bacterium]
MKITLSVLLSGLLLCGCSQNSQKQPSSSGPAIDLIQASNDTVWQDGAVLHVTKRDGSSVEGIRITHNKPDGDKVTITADTGTLSPGSTEGAADVNSVKLTLHNMRNEMHGPGGNKVITAKEIVLVLER